jgi:phage FluMu gp28-like protein
VLSPEEQDEFEALSRAKQDDAYAADPWLWLCEQVRTSDEATQEMLDWPKDKAYLQDLVAILESDEKLVAIPKSRRMLVSWLCAGWATHRARYFPHNAIFWQSQNETKAAYVVDKRCAFIEDNLRSPELRREYTAIHVHGGLIGRLTYPKTKSYIWAVPQGGEVFRSYTASVVVMDEVDFQEDGHDGLTAAIPLAEKGAKLILVTTSNGPRGVVAGIAKEAGFVRFQR